MNQSDSPETVVQRQLDAYNARDTEAWLATYAVEGRQYEHPGKLVAAGHAQMRERIAARFQEPNLHAKLLQRSVMGQVVIDHEEVTRSFPEGPGRLELIAIYEVRDGRIQTGSFIAGRKTLEARA